MTAPERRDSRRETSPAAVRSLPRSALAGFRFPPDVSSSHSAGTCGSARPYRDVGELLAERCAEVDHVTVYRWVQRLTPLLADAAWPCCHRAGDR